MWSSIKMYVAAFGAALIGILLTIIKVMSFKNEKLKEENKGHVKKEEIREEIKEDKAEIKKEAKDAKEAINTDDWRSGI